MVRRLTGRPMFRHVLAIVAALALALPSALAAQSGGTLKGVIRDAKGQIIEGARVTIVLNNTKRKFETKSDRKGEFLQIGLSSGEYTVTAEKEKLASAPTTVAVRVGQVQQVDFVLGSAAAVAAASPEAAAKSAELRKFFDAGVAAGSAGRHDEAIAQFNQAAAASPTCHECYNNIGFAHIQKKEFDQAEIAYKKASEIKPDDAAAYNGLASVYNAQRKFDLAAQASSKAAELGGGAAGGAGGNADALFNQGVILWNGGKIAEAKKQFEAAVAANPTHAEAHYQLGMALVNEGNLAGAAGEFETYLKLAPSGPNAAQAKALVGQLKK